MAANSWSSIRNINNRRLWIWKKKSLFDLIIQQPDIDKIYLFTKYPYEANYQFLINKRENTWLKHLSDSKTFIEYSNDIDDIYKSIEEYNANKKPKILIVLIILLLICLVIKDLIQ